MAGLLNAELTETWNETSRGVPLQFEDIEGCRASMSVCRIDGRAPGLFTAFQRVRQNVFIGFLRRGIVRRQVRIAEVEPGKRCCAIVPDPPGASVIVHLVEPHLDKAIPDGLPWSPVSKCSANENECRQSDREYAASPIPRKKS